MNRRYPRVVFSADYIYGLPSVGDHQAFDVMKYKKIRDRLLNEKKLKRRHILRPDLCTTEDLLRVHTESYLHDIQDASYLTGILRLDEVNPFYNSILEYLLAVTGGTLLATEFAIRNGAAVFNLGGGYHHAHPDRAEGFCVINDVAIAIEKFRRSNGVNRFMIIDLDYHQGNGNLLYFRDDPEVFTFSIHADTWVEIEGNSNLDILVSSHCSDEEYLEILHRELDPVCHRFRPDMVFYIAGSDPYELDTLADMKLSRSGLLQRNKYIYERVRRRKLPLVVLAGGGYGPDSWQIYYDFLEYALTKRMPG